jgi:hypothetical protein
MASTTPEPFDGRSGQSGSALSSPQIINGISRAVPSLSGFIDGDSPEKADQIEALHKRVAGRIMDLISANGGLYIKLGKPQNQNSRHTLPQKAHLE